MEWPSFQQWSTSVNSGFTLHLRLSSMSNVHILFSCSIMCRGKSITDKRMRVTQWSFLLTEQGNKNDWSTEGWINSQMPAWEVIQDRRRNRMTPQIFSMQRTCDKSSIKTAEQDFIISYIKCWHQWNKEYVKLLSTFQTLYTVFSQTHISYAHHDSSHPAKSNRSLPMWSLWLFISTVWQMANSWVYGGDLHTRLLLLKCISYKQKQKIKYPDDNNRNWNLFTFGLNSPNRYLHLDL